MRVFVGIPVPREYGNELTGIRGNFHDFEKYIRWTPVDQLHVTLNFIGEADEEQICQIEKAIEATLRDQPAFQVRFSNVDVFPHRSNPKVIWAGFDKGSAILTKIHNDLDAKMESFLKCTEIRTYVPHVSIGRIKSYGACVPIEPCLRQCQGYPHKDILFDRVVLYESRMGGSGAQYYSVKKYSLSESL